MVATSDPDGNAFFPGAKTNRGAVEPKKNFVSHPDWLGGAGVARGRPVVYF